MRILVTGAAGFIGSHLCEALALDGNEVVALDDNSSGSWNNLLHIPSERLVRIRGSVTDPDTVSKAVRDCHEVYHLAAVLGVKRVFDHSVRTIEANVKGTATVLEAARTQGSRVLIASTSEVYGKGRQRPFVESDEISLGTSIRWGYAASKAVDEYLARGYFREFRLPTVVVRYFNVVGPRQNLTYGAVVPRFISQALRREPLTVYGDGLQVRSFTWIEDATQATVRLLRQPEAYGEVFNVGTDEAVQIRDLAERIRQLAGSDSPIVYAPYEEVFGVGFEDVLYRVPDLTKIRKAIGYRATLDLDGILGRMIEFLSEQVGGRGQS